MTPLFSKSIFLFLATTLLVACGSTTPVTKTRTLVFEDDPQVDTSSPSTTITSEKTSSDSLIQKEPFIDTAKTITDTVVKSTAKIVDPYKAVPSLVENILLRADTLLSRGEPDSAAFYLERFIVLKPLWSEWQNQAQEIYARTKKTQYERAQEFKPIILQILNMNSAGSAFDLVKAFTDSLISLNPGDSLIQWAQKQKQKSYQKNLDKALQEKRKILNAANESGRFKEAQEPIQKLKARYYYFEDTLKLEATLEQLNLLDAETSKDDQLYWRSHDPEAALKEAQKLASEKKYKQAHSLLIKLKASDLRQRAIEHLESLAEQFCNEERKNASVLFVSSQKKSNTIQKQQKIQQAIEALNRCIETYPDYSQKAKVIDNREFLKKELSR